MAQTAPVPAPIIKEDDPFLVTFSPSEHRIPLTWSSSSKWAVTDILSATGFNRIMVSTIMAPALPLISRELNMSSAEAAMALSIYLLATAFGPLFIGPLSKIYGRKRILHASNVWFLIWNIVCGFANTKGVLIAARSLAGVGASVIYALAGGLTDVWRPGQRRRPLGIYFLIPLLVPLLVRCCPPSLYRYASANDGGTYHRWIYGRSNNSEVDVLVDFQIPDSYDRVLVRLVRGILRAKHPKERSVTAQERDWRS